MKLEWKKQFDQSCRSLESTSSNNSNNNITSALPAFLSSLYMILSNDCFQSLLYSFDSLKWNNICDFLKYSWLSSAVIRDKFNEERLLSCHREKWIRFSDQNIQEGVRHSQNKSPKAADSPQKCLFSVKKACVGATMIRLLSYNQSTVVDSLDPINLLSQPVPSVQRILVLFITLYLECKNWQRVGDWFWEKEFYSFALFCYRVGDPEFKVETFLASLFFPVSESSDARKTIHYLILTQLCCPQVQNLFLLVKELIKQGSYQWSVDLLVFHFEKWNNLVEGHLLLLDVLERLSESNSNCVVVDSRILLDGWKLVADQFSSGATSSSELKGVVREKIAKYGTNEIK
jgi:hypothetical protein